MTKNTISAPEPWNQSQNFKKMAPPSQNNFGSTGSGSTAHCRKVATWWPHTHTCILMLRSMSGFWKLIFLGSGHQAISAVMETGPSRYFIPAKSINQYTDTGKIYCSMRQILHTWQINQSRARSSRRQRQRQILHTWREERAPNQSIR